MKQTTSKRRHDERDSQDTRIAADDVSNAKDLGWAGLGHVGGFLRVIRSASG